MKSGFCHSDVLNFTEAEMITFCSNQINLANLSGGCSSKESHNHSSSDDESDTDDETATRDLNSWRTAVNNATSAAQLSLCVAQLVRCIAWEKSIMKVVSSVCLVCRSVVILGQISKWFMPLLSVIALSETQAVFIVLGSDSICLNYLMQVKCMWIRFC